jgi:hypothetical protein
LLVDIALLYFFFLNFVYTIRLLFLEHIQFICLVQKIELDLLILFYYPIRMLENTKLLTPSNFFLQNIHLHKTHLGCSLLLNFYFLQLIHTIQLLTVKIHHSHDFFIKVDLQLIYFLLQLLLNTIKLLFRCLHLNQSLFNNNDQGYTELNYCFRYLQLLLTISLLQINLYPHIPLSNNT